jgi:hypothetical protein
MTNEQEALDRAFERFRARLRHIDEISQIVLNGHLEVETGLDDLLNIAFFHPEYLRDSRLTFFQKTKIAQAQALGVGHSSEWPLMLMFNSLRNEIAHGGATEKRTDKIDELRKMLFGMGTAALHEKLNKADDKEIVIYTAAMCAGFLSVLEETWEGLRKRIDNFDSGT